MLAGVKANPEENVPQGASPRTPQSRDQAAAAVGISGKLVSAAKAIKAASPERFEKVKAGKLTIAKAKKEIKAEQDKRDLIEAPLPRAHGWTVSGEITRDSAKAASPRARVDLS